VPQEIGVDETEDEQPRHPADPTARKVAR
jgi:hypothetical protein